MTSQLRQIRLCDNDTNSANTQFPNNSIKTTKYNIFTFLPLALLYQFKNYSNIYFLLVAIILAIKEISPQEPTVAIIPFVCVIIIGLLVEAFEEVKKWRNDTNFNNSLSILVNANTKEETEIKWCDLKVGDIIHIKKNETIPADVLILKTSSLNNFCYMQTTNLDGESSLKPRETMPLFQSLFTNQSGVDGINWGLLKDGVIELENPSCNIYQCNGSISISLKKPMAIINDLNGNGSDNNTKAFFQIENSLLRGTTLKNVDYVYGLILYTGKDTKIMMNIQPSSVKSSSIEDIINYILIGVICFVFILCIICSAIGMVFLNKHVPDYINNLLRYDYIYYSHNGNYPYTLEFFKLFGAYFILFNNIIPISLAITFTIAKVIQIIIIEFDPQLQLDPSDHLKVLSNRLQEDLGKVRFIFSDKTGTLTRNEMMFKGCSVYGQLYYNDNSRREREMENRHTGNRLQSRKDILSLNDNHCNGDNDKEYNNVIPLESKLINGLNDDIPIQAVMSALINEKQPVEERFNSTKEALTEFYLNISLNHNVLSEYDEVKQQFTYQGPNPDEVALVSMAKNIGIEFIERIGNKITLKLKDTVKEYEILQVFPYSSERKRSGVIIKESIANVDTLDNTIKLYVKGADDKLFSMIDDFSRSYLLERSKEHLDFFAKNGLRTLCYASKLIEADQYASWATEYNKIKTASLIDKSMLSQVESKIAEIEANVLLLGVSGLEDRLQDQTKEDIAKFIEAGIQVWMITGDQLDTAESIGYSSNLFEDDTEVFKIRSTSSKEDILEYMKKTAEEIEKSEEEIRQFKIQYRQKKGKKDMHRGNKIIGNEYNNSEVNEMPINNGKDKDSGKDKETNELVIDDMSIMRYMFNQHLFGESINAKNEAHSFIKCINQYDSNDNRISHRHSHNEDNQEERLIVNPDDLYHQYKSELAKLNEQKKSIDKLMMISNFKFNNSYDNNKSLSNQQGNSNCFNYGFVIEGNALIHCLSDEIKDIFYQLIIKSRSIICCRCTPIQKSNIVQFIKERSNQICLAIGDGGNDVNMIKKANIGVGIFGKEGHQAAYNSDYAIGQFKYLKQLLFDHGRYILLRNTYFIYFFFYKGILFCFPNFIYGFYTGFSGTNFYDFVWFTFYTGLISTAPPVVYMVFEEDIDVSFKAEPKLKNLLPDIYREFRDSSSFSVGKYFVVFALGMIHSTILFLWSIYAFDKGIVDSEGRAFSYWSPSNMVMLVVLIVQFSILFLDTLKWSLWVFLVHLLQIVINILFGMLYGLGNGDELSAYTFDTLGNGQFWLILICGTLICLIPVYFSRFIDYLFAETIINNIRNGKADKEFKKKALINKIEYMNKCTRNLSKFKRIYRDIDKYKADNFADWKMKEVVQMYCNDKLQLQPHIEVNNEGTGEDVNVVQAYPNVLLMQSYGQTPRDNNIMTSTKCASSIYRNDLKGSNNNNFNCNKVDSDCDIISELASHH